MTAPAKPKLGVVSEAHAAMIGYCAERGITEEDAKASGFEPLDVAETAAVAPSPGDACERTSFQIPFFDLNGKKIQFGQYKPLGKPVGFKKTKDRKRPLRYFQPAGSETPVYLSPLVVKGVGKTWAQIAKDPSIDLFATEGAAKAAAACARGFATIAFTSVDTWHVGGDKDTPAPLFNEFDLRGRNFYVVFDSDAQTKPGVRRSQNELAAFVERRRGFPIIVPLPHKHAGDKKGQGLDDFLAAEGTDAFRRLIANLDALPDKLDDVAPILDSEPEPIEFAIEPYLPRGELVEMHGPHGQFKSTIMLDAALCIATGEKWGGREVTRGRAIFISLEDQKRTLALRIRAWLAGRSEGRSEAEVERLTKAIKDPRRFQLLTREKAASLTVTTAEFGQTVVRAAVLDRIVKLCQGASLLVMETASRLHPVSEDNQSLSVFAGAVERIATRTGAGVVVVRHVSKERAGSDKADSYGGRGGGAFADAARSVLSVVPREKDSDPVRLVHTKSTHAPKGADLAWMWEAKQGAVFLRTASVKEKLKADSDRILAHVRNAGPKGLTWSEIEKKVNKTKIAATAWLLLDSLVQRKLVEEKIRKPERGQETTAYVVTQDGIDALPAAAEVRRPGREIKGQD